VKELVRSIADALDKIPRETLEEASAEEEPDDEDGSAFAAAEAMEVDDELEADNGSETKS
jgi:hypothetical protein